MGRCPLCSSRPAKRFCPAKEASICPVCCGTKREVEIDCPASCPHLRVGRSYESEKRPLEPQLAAKVHTFDENFLNRYSPVLDALSSAVVEERLNSPSLVDLDVIEVYKAMSATMKTLSSGIYYETLPAGAARLALFQRLKAIIDELMQPRLDSHALKVSDVLEVLDFLTLSATLNSNSRPKSRQYLDWLLDLSSSRHAPHEASSLILP